MFPRAGAPKPELWGLGTEERQRDWGDTCRAGILQRLKDPGTRLILKVSENKLLVHTKEVKSPYFKDPQFSQL